MIGATAFIAGMKTLRDWVQDDDDDIESDQYAWRFMESLTGYLPAQGLISSAAMQKIANVAGDRQRAARYGWQRGRNPAAMLLDATEGFGDAWNRYREAAAGYEIRGGKRVRISRHNQRNRMKRASDTMKVKFLNMFEYSQGVGISPTLRLFRRVLPEGLGI